MGYTTDFEGRFELDKPLTEEHAKYLEKFCETRRMKRNAKATFLREDPVRWAVGLPEGEEGEYFVGETGMCGQDRSSDIVDYNSPPAGQPGLWCQWSPTKDRRGIEWDGGEKFYHYSEWLQYLINHFLKPWGYVLQGRVKWQGESDDDTGTLHCEYNQVVSMPE